MFKWYISGRITSPPPLNCWVKFKNVESVIFPYKGVNMEISECIKIVWWVVRLMTQSSWTVVYRNYAGLSKLEMVYISKVGVHWISSVPNSSLTPTLERNVSYHQRKYYYFFISDFCKFYDINFTCVDYRFISLFTREPVIIFFVPWMTYFSGV